MVVSEDKRQALVGYYRVLQPVNIGFRRLRLAGLAEDYCYRISGFSETHFGDELLTVGLILSDAASGADTPEIPQGDFQSRLFLLEADFECSGISGA